MTPMAPTRPTRPTRSGGPSLPGGRCQWCLPLRADLAAAAAARGAVSDAIRAWQVPLDVDVAVLLTSELVTNAVTHGQPAAGACVLLAIACDATGLRVEVHDGSDDLPVPGCNTVLDGEAVLDCEAVLDGAEAGAETGRGLLLVTSLSAEWGFYRTPGGKAVYFTLDYPRPSVESGLK